MAKYIEEGTELARGRVLSSGKAKVTVTAFAEPTTSVYPYAESVEDDLEANGFGTCQPRVRWLSHDSFVVVATCYGQELE